ncbi:MULTISPECIES: EF-hand domain-containing protein [Bradyrhizobium]|uniref:EF-hand domain-containing protein n=1 Tax=Bradyrhizobium elkanii TaxID=29448 RepID=A0A4U6RH26_BRAEL|nr:MULTISPECIES: EF-hand domain-containing protein [Bradyrhizobium]MTV14848.1 EF-hand domain-containing protein [Bradyrhizobium sp. BR2003]TKV73574.1 EF-hand domain-containing protein [Bradyrhizobium elkanii]
MLFALGAASSAIDLLSSLMSSKSTTQTGSSSRGRQTTGLFAPSTGTSTSTGSSTGTGSGSGSAQISPLTMGALISAQSQSQTAVANSPTAASRSDALKDLFSQIDADGNGKITQSEFENALGAGGTNTAQADDVFSKLDSNGDGGVSLDEMSQALQSHKGGHHRHHMASGLTDGSGSASGAGGSSSDPLMQALDGATSTSVTNSDGSTTTTTTYADGSKVSMTTPAASSATLNAASSYNIVEQLIQRQAKAISAQDFASVSVSA